jgi:hypothetical protein
VTIKKNRKGSRGVASYLGPPPLLSGEDPAAYEELRGKMLAFLKPTDILEEMYTNDIIDLEWEMKRLRRLKVAQINISKYAAVRDSLIPVIGFEKASEIYGACSKGDPAMMVEIDKSVETMNVDVKEIESRVFLRRLDQVEQFDRMITAAEVRRSRMIDELHRHRKEYAILLKGAIKTIEATASDVSSQADNDDDEGPGDAEAVA